MHLIGKSVLVACVAVFLGTAWMAGAAEKSKPVAADVKFVPLFDGKTLDGWKQLGGKAKYEARDATIVGSSVPNTSNSFLTTKKMYGD